MQLCLEFPKNPGTLMQGVATLPMGSPAVCPIKCLTLNSYWAGLIGTALALIMLCPRTPRFGTLPYPQADAVDRFLSLQILRE